MSHQILCCLFIIAVNLNLFSSQRHQSLHLFISLTFAVVVVVSIFSVLIFTFDSCCTRCRRCVLCAHIKNNKQKFINSTKQSKWAALAPLPPPSSSPSSVRFKLHRYINTLPSYNNFLYTHTKHTNEFAHLYLDYNVVICLAVTGYINKYVVGVFFHCILLFCCCCCSSAVSLLLQFSGAFVVVRSRCFSSCPFMSIDISYNVHNDVDEIQYKLHIGALLHGDDDD